MRIGKPASVHRGSSAVQGTLMKLGETYFLGHLHVVCSNPTADGSVVVFNTSTPRANSDRTCTVKAHEHPSVPHDSIIPYERGEIVTADEQQRMEASPAFAGMRRAPATVQLVRRIQEGALKSLQTSLEIQDIIRQELSNP